MALNYIEFKLMCIKNDSKQLAMNIEMCFTFHLRSALLVSIFNMLHLNYEGFQLYAKYDVHFITKMFHLDSSDQNRHLIAQIKNNLGARFNQYKCSQQREQHYVFSTATKYSRAPEKFDGMQPA